MSLTFDEYGRPFILVREQERKERLKGMAAQKANILSARAVADVLRSSLGPRGLDKILVSPDQDITVTNDGATILKLMDIDSEVGELMVELAQSQDAEVGDGTTGVVVLAGALLEQAYALLDKGIHSNRISEGFDKACEIAVHALQGISMPVDIQANDNELLHQTARSTLNSKVINRDRNQLARLCVDAVLAVADFDRRDVNLDLIKVEGKVGGKLRDTELVRGILLDKDFSHPQMPKEYHNPKIALLTCAFEPPKPKTKHTVFVQNTQDLQTLHAMEQEYFRDMVQRCKDAGATLVMSQWGFDDEANYLLYHNNLPAVRWVGGVELELLAIATGARIVPRFEELSSDKLGTCGSIREISFGTTQDRMLLVEDCPSSQSVTLFIRGGNTMIIEEAKRSLHDALCMVRNLVRDNRVICGGGAGEIAACLAVNAAADAEASAEQYAIRSFADALESIPINLALNSGLDPIMALSEAKQAQQEVSTKGCRAVHGIDCLSAGTSDMFEQHVFETLHGKISQIRLATQVVKMILKVDEVVVTHPEND